MKFGCWIVCSVLGVVGLASKLCADPLAIGLRGELNAELSQLSDSLTLEINQRGFALLSELLTTEWASDWQDKELADAQFTVMPFANVKAEGVKANVEIDAIKLQPSNDGLRLDFTLKNLHVHVDTITLANYFIPALTTVCQSTDISIGNHNPVPVYTHLGLALSDDHKLRLELAGMDFTLDHSHYQTQGPAYCKGVLGASDYITRFLVRRVLAYARKQMVDMLTTKIEALVPSLAARLNEQLAVPVPFEVPDLYLIPGARLQFTVTPHSLTTDDERLRLSLGIRVAAAEIPAQSEDLSALDEAERSPFLAFASLGFNPDLFNHILTALFNNGSREMELAAAMHPSLAESLKVEELSYFWPDLNVIQPESGQLRVFISLEQAPSLSLEQASQSLVGHIPALRLRFQVKLAGHWRDYFIIHQSIVLRVGGQLERGTLALTFKEPQLRVSGSWAKDYTPRDPSFDSSLAEEVFTSILQYAMGTISPLIFDIPAFAAGDGQFTIDHFRIEEPFLKFDFVDQERVETLGTVDERPSF